MPKLEFPQKIVIKTKVGLFNYIRGLFLNKKNEEKRAISSNEYMMVIVLITKKS